LTRNADPVISMLDEQKQVTKKGGTMRLGAHASASTTTSRKSILLLPAKQAAVQKNQVIIFNDPAKWYIRVQDMFSFAFQCLQA
jgi:CTP synthase (UTP-ammonia lyase)